MVTPYWEAPHSSSVAGPVVITICNATDYLGSSPWDQIERARLSACALRAMGKSDLVALTYGFGENALNTLAQSGFRVLDASAVPSADFALSLTSRSNENAAAASSPLSRTHRPDSICTAVKLLAWNLTSYRRLLLSDSDVLLHEDPSPWMLEHAATYFVATPERALRGYPGLNTHLVFLEPNSQVFEILRTSAVHGNFLRYTGTDQDVIEQVFSPRQPLPSLPLHTHSKTAGWCSKGEIHHCAVDAKRANCSVVTIARDTCCPSAFQEASPHCCTPRLGCCDITRAKWHAACRADDVAGKRMHSRCQSLLEGAGIELSSDRKLGRELAYLIHRASARSERSDDAT